MPLRQPLTVPFIWTRTIALGAACLFIAGALPRTMRAQTGRADSSEVAPDDSLAHRVQALYTEGRHLESLELLRPLLGNTGANYTALCLAARAALVLGYADSNPDSATAWLNRAISYGEQAQALDSAGENGRYVTLAAKGQLALIASPLTKARLARQVDQEARALLAIDSLHAGAHDALGRIYLEIAKLSATQRFFARPWLGGDLIHRAQWDSAEVHLRLAVKLQPSRNFYWLDLGTLLFDRARYAEARDALDTMLAVPLETPQQEGFRRQARALLKAIDEKQNGNVVGHAS